MHDGLRLNDSLRLTQVHLQDCIERCLDCSRHISSNAIIFYNTRRAYSYSLHMATGIYQYTLCPDVILRPIDEASAESLRAGSGANDVLLGLVEMVNEVVAEVEVGLDNRRRSESEPLTQADVLSNICVVTRPMRC